MDIKMTVFPAENGESILIEVFGIEKINILIDLGYSDTYKMFIKNNLNELSKAGEKINLLVLTHYDRDHIGGAVEFFYDLLIHKFIDVEEIWVNDYLSLCSNDLSVDNLNEEEDIIYDFSRLTMKSYRMCNNSRTNVKISRDEIMTITKLINKLEFDSRVNKSFKDKIIYRKETKKDNLIKIRNDIEIEILSPKKEKLSRLLLNYLKWFKNNKNLYAYIGENELFELFSSNLDDSIKDIANAVLRKDKTSSSTDYTKVIDDIIRKNENYNDRSLTNNCSIAFSIKYKQYNILFTGDADCKDIFNFIKHEKYNLIKIPHHGSKNNISNLFFKSIECKNFLICTDGSGSSKHPDLETLIYIAQKKNTNVYINYPISEFSISSKAIAELIKRYKLKLFCNYNEVLYSQLIFKEGELFWKAANC